MTPVDVILTAFLLLVLVCTMAAVDKDRGPDGRRFR